MEEREILMKMQFLYIFAICDFVLWFPNYSSAYLFWEADVLQAAQQRWGLEKGLGIGGGEGNSLWSDPGGFQA